MLILRSLWLHYNSPRHIPAQPCSRVSAITHPRGPRHGIPKMARMKTRVMMVWPIRTMNCVKTAAVRISSDMTPATRDLSREKKPVGQKSLCPFSNHPKTCASALDHVWLYALGLTIWNFVPLTFDELTWHQMTFGRSRIISKYIKYFLH